MMVKSYHVLDIVLHSKVRFYLFVFLLFSVFSGCEEEEFLLANPLDPGNPEYIPPQVTIVSGPSEGATLAIPSAKFLWEGNVESSILFRHFFDGLLQQGSAYMSTYSWV